jgi:TPP-dependent indolepyruvate ferredoxin oxidoreductase alpha subunit
MIDFPENDLPALDPSQIKETLESVKEAIRLSNETEPPILELRQLIKERNLPYEQLLTCAASYWAECKLYEFEIENLSKLLDVQEALMSEQDEMGEKREAKHSEHASILEMREVLMSKKRFIEGRFQGRDEQKKMQAVKAANARHSTLGGSRDRQQQIRVLWASGKYSSRDICAEQECAALGMSYSSARKALRGTPDPT